MSLKYLGCYAFPSIVLGGRTGRSLSRSFINFNNNGCHKHNGSFYECHFNEWSDKGFITNPIEILILKFSFLQRAVAPTI
jgi:hypothetical protein